MMKFSLILYPLSLILLSSCATMPRMALHPDQCRAPTAAEAQLTKTVWSSKK